MSTSNWEYDDFGYTGNTVVEPEEFIASEYSHETRDGYTWDYGNRGPGYYHNSLPTNSFFSNVAPVPAPRLNTNDSSESELESESESISTDPEMPELEAVEPPMKFRVPPSQPAPTLHSEVDDTNINSFYNFNGHIETIYKNKIYYITLPNVYDYVTLGKCISSEYYDELNDYICNKVYNCDVKSLANNLKYIEVNGSFNGRVYNKNIVLYKKHHYGQVALGCLEWCVQNPEKVH